MALANPIHDIAQSLRLSAVWWALAREDVADQHRRTSLGPLWFLLTYLSFAAIFIFLFSERGGGLNYPAYVAVGLLVWLFIMETLVASVMLFTQEQGLIKGTRLPLFVYVMRQLVRSVLRLLYALPGCALILVLSGQQIGEAWGWALLALALILLIAPAAIAVCAFVGAYFPDTQFIMVSALRLFMFLTPIFWVYRGDGGVRQAAHDWNPFSYVLRAVRGPILGEPVHWIDFAVLGGGGVLLWALALWLLAAGSRNLVFQL